MLTHSVHSHQYTSFQHFFMHRCVRHRAVSTIINISSCNNQYFNIFTVNTVLISQSLPASNYTSIYSGLYFPFTFFYAPNHSYFNTVTLNKTLISLHSHALISMFNIFTSPQPNVSINILNMLMSLYSYASVCILKVFISLYRHASIYYMLNIFI